MRGLVIITGLFLVAGCDVIETVELSCPPPQGHTISVTLSDGPVLPSQRSSVSRQLKNEAMTAARSKCYLHQSNERNAQSDRDRELEQKRAAELTPNKKTGLGGAVGVGVITAGLALIGGTSSSSDTQ